MLAEVRISSWEDYLSIKQEILSDIKLVIAVVGNLKQSIGIARDTPLSKIDRVPDLIAEVVNCDANLNLSVCRLSSISERVNKVTDSTKKFIRSQKTVTPATKKTLDGVLIDRRLAEPTGR